MLLNFAEFLEAVVLCFALEFADSVVFDYELRRLAFCVAVAFDVLNNVSIHDLTRKTAQ